MFGRCLESEVRGGDPELFRWVSVIVRQARAVGRRRFGIGGGRVLTQPLRLDEGKVAEVGLRSIGVEVC